MTNEDKGAAMEHEEAAAAAAAAATSLESILIQMIQDYQDLNPSFVDELDCSQASVTALQFARFVSRNRPVVLRGLGHTLQIPALQRWTSTEHLVGKLGGEKQLRIAATPEGNADAIVDGVFVEPAYVEMNMETFLSRLRGRAKTGNATDDVLYLQSQNDNLHDEMHDLLEDATDELPFASEVFGSSPEAANVWIGDERSVTSLHKDPYENLYLVVQGTKTFDLLPPTEFYCLHERMFPCGQYVRSGSPASAGVNGDETSRFSIKRDESGASTPWIPVDPAQPDLKQFPRFRHARPLRVTVKRGDVLYLPALWYHRVSQTASEDPACPYAIAVNWWYDLDYGSPTWTLASTVRKMTLAVDGIVEES